MNKLNNIKIPQNIKEVRERAIEKGFEEKAKRDKNIYKKTMIASLSGLLFVGMIVINSQTVLAYVESITKSIESFLGREDKSLKKYTFSNNQIFEKDGMKITLGDVLLDQRQLILTLEVDYSNFNKQNISIEDLDFGAIIIEVNGVTYAGQGGSVINEKIDNQDKANIFIKKDLFEIDTNNDGVGDTPYNLIDNLKVNQDYDMNIKFNNIYMYDIQNNDSIGLLEPFGFKTKINTKNIVKNSIIKDINKEIEITQKGYEGKLIIEKIGVSPISVEVKSKFKSKNDVNETYEPTLFAIDENGNELRMHASSSSDETTFFTNTSYDLSGNESKIIIKPGVVVNEKVIYENESIEIDIK